MSPIHDAAIDGDLAGIQAELNKGVDVNVKDEGGGGGTPLHEAAYESQTAAIELLLTNGADVNVKDEDGVYSFALCGCCGVEKEIVYLLNRLRCGCECEG